jgi:hypothetical protein
MKSDWTGRWWWKHPEIERKRLEQIEKWLTFNRPMGKLWKVSDRERNSIRSSENLILFAARSREKKRTIRSDSTATDLRIDHRIILEYREEKSTSEERLTFEVPPIETFWDRQKQIALNCATIYLPLVDEKLLEERQKNSIRLTKNLPLHWRAKQHEIQRQRYNRIDRRLIFRLTIKHPEIEREISLFEQRLTF